MALFVKQNDERSDLQKNIAAELQRKATEKAKLADQPDLVDDSQYVKTFKPATRLSWFWILVSIIVAGFIIWLTVVGGSR